MKQNTRRKPTRLVKSSSPSKARRSPSKQTSQAIGQLTSLQSASTRASSTKPASSVKVTTSHAKSVTIHSNQGSVGVASRRSFSSAATTTRVKTPQANVVEPNKPADLHQLSTDQLSPREKFLLGQPIPPRKGTMKPVYPFVPHAVDPKTGDYVLRDGVRREGVIDTDTPLSRQALEYKRRIVNNYNAVTDPSKVIGDPSVYQSRVEANRERTAMLFDDDIRPFLNRHTRQSEIYHDTTPELRTPRTPLPADTGTSISPTAGVLHAYRMHFVRMYLHHKKRKRVWDEQMPFENAYGFDSTIEPVKGGNQEALQEFMHYVKGVACARNSNFVPTDTVAFLGGIKKLLPMVAKVDEVKVVHVRRRKK